MTEHYIVYQAYGSEDILNEALYSMLSFFKVHGPDCKDIRLVVYTDTPQHFEAVLGKERISCRPVDPAKIRQWRGAIDFVHRVKIETLIDFTAGMDDASVLYLDSDITFLQPVQPLFDRISKGEFIMHQFEGKLNQSSFPLIRKMGRFISAHQQELQAKGVDVPGDSGVWNAGVIGFHTRSKAVLSKVLCFTDVFYSMYPKHIAEQFGFSLYLGKTGTVFESTAYLFHYWSFKEFRTVLNDFFSYHRKVGSDRLALTEDLDKIAPQRLGEPKRIYDNMHWLPKAFRKLRKNRWEMPHYKYWE